MKSPPHIRIPVLFIGILFASLLGVSVPARVHAVSGTCSDHGGVDCRVGPDWDGSAICKDGWTDSSEQYYGQVECQSTPMCTQYLWEQMSDTEEKRTDSTQFYMLLHAINTLNIEYPMIAIRDEEAARGGGGDSKHYRWADY